MATFPYALAQISGLKAENGRIPSRITSKTVIRILWQDQENLIDCRIGSLKDNDTGLST